MLTRLAQKRKVKRDAEEEELMKLAMERDVNNNDESNIRLLETVVLVLASLVFLACCYWVLKRRGTLCKGRHSREEHE